MIQFANVEKSYGGKVLYRNGSFQLGPGEKMGLVGPNGAGKTTIFRLIMGTERPQSGQISKSEKWKIAYFSQDIAEMSGRTVIDEVKSGAGRVTEVASRLKTLESLLGDPLPDDKMQKVLEEYGELQTEFEQLGGYDLDSRAAAILLGLGFSLKDQNKMTETFSGGWKMRIALAKVLLLNPDALLMDEPTNHLDMESILWLEGWLQKFDGALLMTSHDREFLNRLVNKIVEVAHQSITVYSGNYDFYEREREIRLQQLIAQSRRQEEMLAKEQEFISRFAARASHAAQVQSRVKKLEKIERVEVPTEEKEIKFEWPEPPRGGDEVVKFENLGKTWVDEDGGKVVFKGASGLVKRLDRVAVVGVNGAGKSTFLKVITGQTEPTEGTFTVGPSIELGYFSQNSLDLLNPENTILEELHNRVPLANVGTLRSLLGAFKFSGDEAEKKIKVLSGGEKSRVLLATLLIKPLNFLVLDEPTNHLDMQSRQVLLEALENFQGTVMMVSHDRHFLRRLTTRVFEIDKSQLTPYDGSFDYYMEKRRSLFESPVMS